MKYFEKKWNVIVGVMAVLITYHSSLITSSAQTLLSLDSCRAMALRNSKQIGVAEFFIEAAEIKQGDEFLVTGETTGAYEGVFDDIRIDLKQSGMKDATLPENTAVKGVYFSAKTDKVLHRGDKLYKLVKN